MSEYPFTVGGPGSGSPNDAIMAAQEGGNIAPQGPITASGVVLTGAGRLVGWCVSETSGSAAAAVRIYDGAGINTQAVARIAVPANSTNAVGPGSFGIACDRGLYVQIQSGAAEVYLYFAAIY
jgi:hypothetical protein